jgi:hypothetical protein
MLPFFSDRRSIPLLFLCAFGAAACGTSVPGRDRVIGDAGSTVATDGGAPSTDGGSPSDGGGIDAGLAIDGGASQDAGTSGDGGVCEPGTNKSRSRLLPIVNGTRQPTYLPLDAAQQNAVIGLAFDATSSSDCSGVLVAPNIVLTAKHCTEGESASSLYVLFGVDDEAPTLRARVAQKREHPTHDVSLLTLSQPPSDTIDVRPIPIALEDLSSADIGITVEQGGYGQTAPRGSGDGRFFAAERLAGFEDEGDVLVVDGQGLRGVCYGDSGGPSMRISPAGDARVIGVLSWGDPTCVDRDRFARTDVVRAWIEETVGPTPGGGPQPCTARVTAEGYCNATGSQATYCEGGIQQFVMCGSGDTCAWSASANGYRCVPAASDPCAGVTHYGVCDGEVLRWCDRTVLRERNCLACGERCRVESATEGYKCAPSNCGNLSYEGRCNGNVAEWCNRQGDRESLDCAARGQVCGYINSEIGYYCTDEACGDLTYQGRCDGNVAVWCENGSVRRRDCARRGLVCRFVDDQVGYACREP